MGWSLMFLAADERAIRNSGKGRDTVLDPFGGSGTTPIACEKAGRQARLVELEPKYCDRKPGASRPLPSKGRRRRRRDSRGVGAGVVYDVRLLRR